MTNINQSVLMMFETDETEEEQSKPKSFLSRHKGKLALGLALGLAANRKNIINAAKDHGLMKKNLKDYLRSGVNVIKKYPKTSAVVGGLTAIHLADKWNPSKSNQDD